MKQILKYSVIFTISLILLLTANHTAVSIDKDFTNPGKIQSQNNYEIYDYNNGIINISSDSGFINHPAVRYGRGTKTNPYLIENWHAKKIVMEKIYDTYFEINNCYFDGGYAFDFYKVNNGIIKDSIIESSNGYDGIKLIWSSNNYFSNCKINNYLRSFYLRSFSNNNIIENCEINGKNQGFIITYSKNNEIKNCEIKNTQYYGLRLEKSDFNIISDCTIKNYNSPGWTGIELQSSSENEIYNCDISGWLAGIELYSSDAIIKSCNNWIHLNDFYDNTDYNAKELNGFDNTWRLNYWDDYSGKDDDKNGIGDSSYKKGIGFKDEYPLMARFQTPIPPTVSGPEQVKPFKKTTFYFETTDFQGDDVYYYVHWGEYHTMGPYGPYSSDEKAEISYTFSYEGTKEVKAKATDIEDISSEDLDGMISDWGNSYRVKVNKCKTISKSIEYTIFEKILGLFLQNFNLNLL